MTIATDRKPTEALAQAMMPEMEGEESLFPVVLFTNGAAVLANQLYHTAMLLLLHMMPWCMGAHTALVLLHGMRVQGGLILSILSIPRGSICLSAAASYPAAPGP